MLSFITPDTLDELISSNKKPVLLGFLENGEPYADQVKALESIFKIYGNKLEICLGDEYFLDTFFDKFGFGGTPHYILIKNGREKNRLLGRADCETLVYFLKESGIRINEKS